MSWDRISDYMNAFLGAAFIGIGTLLIPEIRTKKKFWISALCLILFLCFLGFDKINRDDKKQSSFDSKIDSLTTTIVEIKSSSIKTQDYLQKLDSIGIKRDTVSNNPIITKNFINYIDKVEMMNQIVK
jgi:hypothetical protein